MSLDFNIVDEKIKEIQGILSKLDHVVNLLLQTRIYSNGDNIIEMPEGAQQILETEYHQIKAELEAKVGTLPEGD